MDEKDSTIYKILNNDGRTKVVDISKALELSHPSTKERLNKLLTNGDMTVKALLNVEKLGWKTAICCIKTENLSEGLKLADYFKKCPRVVFVGTSTGTHNLHIIITAQNSAILQMTIENVFRPIPSINSLDISIGDTPIKPTFMDVRMDGNLDKPPCGVEDCAKCYLYLKKCGGCPATKYWKGF